MQTIFYALMLSLCASSVVSPASAQTKNSIAENPSVDPPAGIDADAFCMASTIQELIKQRSKKSPLAGAAQGRMTSTEDFIFFFLGRMTQHLPTDQLNGSAFIAAKRAYSDLLPDEKDRVGLACARLGSSFVEHFADKLSSDGK